MRTCISCGDQIPEKKRKHAKYCDKAACRGREYRKRQAEGATATRSDSRTPHTSTVLSCPCGRQYLLQVHELDATASSPTPKLSPAALLPESLTQTVLPTEPQPNAAEAQPCNSAPVPESLTQADRSDSPASASSTLDLVTLELYFTDQHKRRIPFGRAMHRHGDGRWSLQPHAQVAFAYNERRRGGLGGKPGAWHEFYGARSPSEFGYDPDLVVMSWNRKIRRGQCVSIDLLRDILGNGWKEKLRAVRDGRS